MRKLMMVLGIIAVVIVVLVAGRNFLIKAGVESGVKALTGLSLEIGKLDIGLFKTAMQIKDLKLFNPAGYPDKLMVDLPEVYVDYSLQKAVQGKVHLPEVRLNLNELTVVKNARGELNLNSLAVVQQKQGQSGQAKPTGKQQAKMPPLKIDLLRLDIGKVVYKDYSGGGEPRVQEFKVNLHQTYKNITDPQAFVSLVMVKALGNTTIAGLTGFDLKGIKGVAGSVADTAGKTAVEVTGTLADTVRKFLPGGDKN